MRRLRDQTQIIYAFHIIFLYTNNKAYICQDDGVSKSYLCPGLNFTSSFKFRVKNDTRPGECFFLYQKTMNGVPVNAKRIGMKFNNFILKNAIL